LRQRLEVTNHRVSDTDQPAEDAHAQQKIEKVTARRFRIRRHYRLFLHFGSPDAGSLFASNSRFKPLFFLTGELFLNSAGMALGAGKLGILRIDVHEIVTFRIHLIKFFAAALGENEMARLAVARLDRHLTIGRVVFAVVAAEAAIPVLVADEIRVRAPIKFHFREKIVSIDGLRLMDDWVSLGRVGIGFA